MGETTWVSMPESLQRHHPHLNSDNKPSKSQITRPTTSSLSGRSILNIMMVPQKCLLSKGLVCKMTPKFSAIVSSSV